MLNCKFLLLFAILSVCYCKEGMNLLNESMKDAIAKLGESCMKDVNATMEEMESIRKGPPYQGNTACIISCILEKSHMIKDKTFSKKGFMNTITPFIMMDKKKMNHWRRVATTCDKEVQETGVTGCQVANEIMKCFHNHIPALKELKFSE